MKNKLTFVIPYNSDNFVRRLNFDIIYNYISDNFDCDVLVNEDLELEIFSRTKALNSLNRKVSTPYVCACDSDVLCDIPQILKALEYLETGSDLVFPFDGCVKNIMRLEYITNKGKKEILHYGEHSPRSVSGIVLYNLDKFKSVGMENEKFNGWGGEEEERYIRCAKLGLKIDRVPGNIYHLYHSRPLHDPPNFQIYSNNMKELSKVRTMSKSDLKKYISTW